MKKLLLTGITAALFSVAAIAQERQQESNEFRETTEEMERDADQAADSASTDFQQGVNEVEQETEEAGDNIQRESQEFRQDAEQAGENIEEGAERAGDEIEQGAEEAGQEIEQGAERTGNELQEGTQEAGRELRETGDQMEQSTDSTLNEMNDDFKSGVEGENAQGSSEYNSATELEVVKDKEGPNNEVVYKYQDEYFYVDREEKKIVKAKESDLEEANHDVIVKDGESNADDNATSDNRDEKNQN